MRQVTVLAVVFAMSSISGQSLADPPAGPVFGLATAPDGSLLITDALAGIAVMEGDDATLLAGFPGASDVAPIGKGSWWVVRGAPDGGQFSNNGQGLYRVSRGQSRLVANLFEWEVANDPVPPAPNGGPESNPFDVESLGGGYALVADAAGNTLLKVSDEGVVSLVAAFPYEPVSTADVKALLGCPGSGADPCFAPDVLPAQPVPTSIARDADGNVYVGELKGFPAPKNESRIWRIAPGAQDVLCGTDAGCELVYDGGFTSIIDLAWGPDGLLYVLELDENTWFATTLPTPPLLGGTLNACDPDGGGCTEVATGLVLPTALTFDKQGNLWSTEFALIPGAATVTGIP